MPGQQAGDDSARTGIPAAPNLLILSINSAECTLHPALCTISGPDFPRMVPVVAGGHHEDHVLRNIGGVIADPLEVPGNQD